MALVNYSSSSSASNESEDDNSEDEEIALIKIAQKRPRLESNASSNKKPLPNPFTRSATALITKSAEEQEYDNPSKHDGRIRSFKHERGNWATFVCINATDSSLWTDLEEMCCTTISQISDFHAIHELHMSLSRTVILQYHLIDSFTKSLQRELLNLSKFHITMSQLKVYCNEERTRTFIALEVNKIYYGKLCELLLKVNNVMEEFKLPKFYEDPSFHISFLWCLGDKVDLINKYLDKLNSMLEDPKAKENIFNMRICEVHCKSGNKDFTFVLA